MACVGGVWELAGFVRVLGLCPSRILHWSCTSVFLGLLRLARIGSPALVWGSGWVGSVALWRER